MKTKEVQPISRETQLRVDEFEKSYWRTTGKKMLKDWRLYVMLIPLILVFLFWRYFPMYELTQSFKDYDTTKDLAEMNYVGLYWFEQLFFGSYSDQFWPAFRNTFLLSFYGLLFGFPTPILLALFFSEIKSNVVRSIFQVCSYLPKFVSMVVITSLIQLMLKKATISAPSGVLSRALAAIGIITEAEADAGLMFGPQYFRSIFQISGVWAEAGYGSIVYFAAIIGISPTSYEAARIDGASKMQQIKTVVIPGILSTVVIMLITRLGHLMTVGYEKVLLLTTTTGGDLGSGNQSTAEVISTWVFKIGGMQSGSGSANPSLGSAADMVNAVISMLLVTGANMISRRASNTSLY